MAGVLVSLAVLAFWLYSMFDVITTPEDLIRNAPKPLWLLAVVLIPVLGGLTWLLAGRPLSTPPSRPIPTPPTAKGPEDDPEFLRDLNRRMRDEE
ncbi:PLD nuclease N-terminal domain-containing protein [Nonomuraea sp. NBC_01738]|uniref:PLD nuclease N-terminal domain-containing protein n=1 Tax=Nonomuraea sp. NBC_01738 TaxID=2976003 RepID=UPI002E0D8837|nr:PLD nuclease N-terminal domain-containing protein [Nonomuraea sp. NBC_01738]